MLWFKKKEKITFDWLCSEKQCKNFAKQLQNIFIARDNIHELEKKLEKCNKCYMEKRPLNMIPRQTRNTLSAEIIYYKLKNKH